MQDQASVGDEMKKVNGEALWSAPTTGPLDPSLAAKDTEEMTTRREGNLEAQLAELLVLMRERNSNNPMVVTAAPKTAGDRLAMWIPTVMTALVLLVGGIRFDAFRENATSHDLSDLKARVEKAEEDTKALKAERDNQQKQIAVLNGEIEGFKTFAGRIKK